MVPVHCTCQVRSVQSFMHFNGRLSGGTMATGILLDEAADAVQAWWVGRWKEGMGRLEDGGLVVWKNRS